MTHRLLLEEADVGASQPPVILFSALSSEADLSEHMKSHPLVGSSGDVVVVIAGSLETAVGKGSFVPLSDKEREWREYLHSIATSTSPTVTHAAKELWTELRQRVSTALEPPHAGPTEGRGLLMVWDRGQHHLEFEIAPSGCYDWFYRDRSTDTYKGEEDCLLGAYFSPELSSTIRVIWPEETIDAGTLSIDLIAMGSEL